LLARCRSQFVHPGGGWQAFSFVLGVIIFAAVAYREGWEAVLFLLIFLAIWQLATFEPAGHL
jgi:hypothetical protein